jgi:hypothetical protein
MNLCSFRKTWTAFLKLYTRSRNQQSKKAETRKQYVMKFAKVRNLGLFIMLISAAVAAQENPVLQKLLEQRLSNCNCSVVIVDPSRGTLLASLNADPILKEKHPSSSLMKIFTLMAYAQNHNGKFPEYFCPPSLATNSLGCWDRNGHGNVNAQKAVAYSCNVYFRQLAEQTSAETFAGILQHFGITQATDSSNPSILHKVMTGSTTDWNVSPFKILRAYCSIFNGGKLWKISDRSQNQIAYLPSSELRALIHSGLLEGAIHGTSTLAKNAAGVEMLGKTGTSLMVMNGKTDFKRTQGWWIGLYPADAPEVAIMTFVRDGRGATDAAPKGGLALAAWLKLFNFNSHS